MAQQESSGSKAKGCVKLRRCSKFKNYYKAQPMRTERNKKKRLGRHIRNFPNDMQAQSILTNLPGVGAGPAAVRGNLANLTRKGKRVLERSLQREFAVS